MFVNGECIYGVRPWIVTNENDLWFTHNRRTETLYVIVKEKDRWKHGEWKDLILHSVRATEQTKASVLGQNDQALEYQAEVVPQTTFEQTVGGLKIRAMRAQRLYNDRKWPNPVVIKLTHVKPALVPPRVETLKATGNTAKGVVELRCKLHSLGDAKAVEACAEYRDITGLDVNERLENWVATPAVSRTDTGEFVIPVNGLQPGRAYELRAKVEHPLLTVFGSEFRFTPATAK